MSGSAPSIQMMRQADRERLAKMVNEQSPVTREIWDQQIRLFEAAGRENPRLYLRHSFKISLS